MKKIILSLLSFSTIISADSLKLDCTFPDGWNEIIKSYKGWSETIKIYNGDRLSFDSVSCSDYGKSKLSTFSDDWIYLSGYDCSISINRESGHITITSYWGSNTIKKVGTCVKKDKANAF